jgi:hypothetical protein
MVNMCASTALTALWFQHSQVKSRFHHLLKTLWPESASELYRLSDRRLTTKLVATFAGIGRYVVNVTDLYTAFSVFLDLRRYFFFQAAPQLYSRG